MTTEHFLSDDVRGIRLFTEVGSRLAKALIPQVAIDLIRVGRLTALSKSDGGVQGNVAGDVVRCLVARTMAQQLSKAVEWAIALFQCALSMRAGCECLAHVLQGITELHPELTITSIDGISAFDLISRESMLRGWKSGVEGPHSHSSGCSMVPLRNVYGRTTKGLCTGSFRVRGANRAMPRCLCCSQSGSMVLWRPSTGG